MNIIKITLISFFVFFLNACSWNDVGVNAINQIDHNAKDSIQELSPNFNYQQRRSFVQVSTPKNELLNGTISHLNIVKPIALEQAIKLAIPEAFIIPEDTSVDLQKEVSFAITNKTYKQFFELLASQTGYSIELQNDYKILISAADHKRWNISALVNLPNVSSAVGSNAAAGQAGGSSSLSTSKSDDTWATIITGLKAILGPSGVIVDNRRLGEIYALGDPQKLNQADKWMRRMIDSSQKQILLDVAILEITSNEGSGNGIDWKAIYNQGGANEASISRSAQQTLSTGSGVWSVVGKYVAGKFNLDATINFLRTQGKVNVQHHPSLTVTNGSTAYLGSAEQFSYISALSQQTTTTDGGGNNITITPTVEKIDVGVNIAMTARVLENNEILIEVVPVISSLQKLDELTYTDSTGQQTLNTPRISLQELSTQVITKSGQPIHLGGLMTEKIAEGASNVPGTLGRLFNLVFQSEKKEFEKKEILLIITPTEI